MNRYAKIFLTIIAGSLLLLNLYLIRNVDVISNAYAAADKSGNLLHEEQCQEVQQAVGSFLGIADYHFKESEKNKKNGKESKSLESFEGAINFSELAENYSTVYLAWCRGSIHHQKKGFR